MRPLAFSLALTLLFGCASSEPAEPARAEPALGLSRGSASVHLLPSGGGGRGREGKFLPSEGCLQRSEFLEPLSEGALEQLRKVVLAL